MSFGKPRKRRNKVENKQLFTGILLLVITALAVALFIVLQMAD